MILAEKSSGSSLGLDNKIQTYGITFDVYDNLTKQRASVRLNLQSIILLNNHLSSMITKHKDESQTNGNSSA